MNKKIKKNILVITGTRAEYGLLRPTFFALQKSPVLVPQLLVTGMHTLKKYGFSLKDIKADGIPIAQVVRVGEKDDMLTALSKEIVGIKNYCIKHRPDLIIVLGDRDEPFAAAIVGGHLHIPVAHIHGGDVTGPVVDEYIRHSITKFSHLHFTATSLSHKRVLALGEEPWRVHTVGAPGLDEIKSTELLSSSKLAHILGLSAQQPWWLIVQHPTFSLDISVSKQIEDTLAVTDMLVGEKIVVYPNSDTGSEVIIETIERRRSNSSYHIFKNIPRSVYISLLSSIQALIGNSSSGIIEAGYFKLPVIDIGPRQVNRECAKNVIHVPYEKKQIERAVQKVGTLDFRRLCCQSKHPYGRGGSAEKITHIIEKYINDPRLLSKKSFHQKF